MVDSRMGMFLIRTGKQSLRKLVSSLVYVGALSVLPAYALDLGALHVYSRAGEPLDAEIKLLEVEGLSSEQIKPRLAGVDDLAISGLDRNSYLSNVRFFVAIENNRSATLRLVSDEPIQQSYLSFLLEVKWPEGRLLREYTSLLEEGDSYQPVAEYPARISSGPQTVPSGSAVAGPSDVTPPKKDEAPVEIVSVEPVKPFKKVVTAPVVPPSPENRVVLKQPEPESQLEKDTEVLERSRPAERPTPVFVRDSERVYVREVEEAAAALEQSRKLKAVSSGQSISNASSRVESALPSAGENGHIAIAGQKTLWQIAEQNKPSEKYSTQQMMMALYDKNPSAFLNGDVNRLRSQGALVAPTPTEIERYGQTEALHKLRAKLHESSQLAKKEVKVASSHREVVVGPKETLWDIAVRYRSGPEVNTRQMMLALLRKNPHAFDGGNINRLLKGSVLQMPDASDLGQVSAEGASEEVRRQIAEWRQQEGLPSEARARNRAATEVAPVLPVQQPVKQAGFGGVPVSVEPSVPASESSVRSIKIGKQETLWTIAISHLPDNSVTTGEMIKAIMKKNPHAFINGNMNEMRVGATLDIPTLAEIKSLNAN